MILETFCAMCFFSQTLGARVSFAGQRQLVAPGPETSQAGALAVRIGVLGYLIPKV